MSKESLSFDIVLARVRELARSKAKDEIQRRRTSAGISYSDGWAKIEYATPSFTPDQIEGFCKAAEDQAESNLLMALVQLSTKGWQEV